MLTLPIICFLWNCFKLVLNARRLVTRFTAGIYLFNVLQRLNFWAFGSGAHNILTLNLAGPPLKVDLLFLRVAVGVVGARSLT